MINKAVEFTDEEAKKAQAEKYEYGKQYNLKYVDENRKKINEQHKQWLTPEKRKEYQTRYWLKKALAKEKILENEKAALVK